MLLYICPTHLALVISKKVKDSLIHFNTLMQAGRLTFCAAPVRDCVAPAHPHHHHLQHAHHLSSHQVYTPSHIQLLNNTTTFIDIQINLGKYFASLLCDDNKSWYCSRPTMRSPTNLVLLAMAVCDLLTITIPAPW